MDDPAEAIAAKLDELRHHRDDGIATTTDIIRVLEILQMIAPSRNDSDLLSQIDTRPIRRTNELRDTGFVGG
jgi:hypothetical protein